MKDTIKKEGVEMEAEVPSIKHIQILDHTVEMVFYEGKITFRLSGNVNVNDLSSEKKEELLKQIRKLQDNGTIYRLFGLPPQNTQLLPSGPSNSEHGSKREHTTSVGRPPLLKPNQFPSRIPSPSSSSIVPSTATYSARPTTIYKAPGSHHTNYGTPSKKITLSNMSPQESLIMNLSGVEVAHSLVVQKEMRRLLVQDQEFVLKPNYQEPFVTREDAISRLLPYHLYYYSDVNTWTNLEELPHGQSLELLANRSFELYKRYETMLRKEAIQASSTAIELCHLRGLLRREIEELNELKRNTSISSEPNRTISDADN